MPSLTRIPLSLRETRLASLVQVVQTCRACPSMEGRKRVLSSSNGDARASVMFIAEAPGRNGADRTGIPLFGDPTGINFEMLLKAGNFTRGDVFITNCVLCNPRDQDGNNRPPSDGEMANCSIHLESQIRTVDPTVVVTLGAKPLAALSLVRPHSFTLRENVAKVNRWLGRILYPLYHPSPRALIARKLSVQEEDFRNLRKLIDSMETNRA